MNYGKTCWQSLISASWRAKERIDKFVDAYSALSENQKATVLKNCLSITSSPHVFVRVVNIAQIVGFLSSEGGTYFHTTSTTIRKAMQVLHPEGLDRLGRSLRYLRLARESISLEQKFLNLWISLESLFTGANASILTILVDYVPSLYAISTIKRRCIYLRDVLAANEIPITPLVAQVTGETGATFTTGTSLSSIYKIINNEPAGIELFDSLGNLEHLKYKILTICIELKTNSSIEQRMERSISDVSRQIRRIYLLRNRITHTGHYEKIRPQLVTHLFDYVAVCYMAICESAECVGGDEKYSVSDLLMAYKIGIDNQLKNCRSNKKSLSVLADFEPHPLV